MVKSAFRHLFQDVTTHNTEANMSDHRILKATIYCSSKNINRSIRRPRKPKPTCSRLDALAYKAELSSRKEDLDEAEYEDLMEIAKEAYANNMIPAPSKGKRSDKTRLILQERSRIILDPNSTHGERKAISRAARESIKEDLQNWKNNQIQFAIDKRRSLKKVFREMTEKSELFTTLTLPNGSKTSNRATIRKEVQAHFAEQFRKAPTPSLQLHFAEANPLPILEAEVAHALAKTKKGAAPGLDDIPAPLLKSGGSDLTRNLARCFNKAIESQSTPKDWNEIRFKLIEKKKKPELLKDIRPIAILSLPGKLFTKVLTKRLNAVAEEFLDETQNGFRAGRGCSDNLQSLTGLWEKCDEFQHPLVLTFIDFKAAFDSIEWHAVQEALLVSGFAPQYAEAIRRSNESGTGEVEIFGTKIRIPVEKGVRQGDSSSPTLFAIALQKLLDDADPLPEDDADSWGIKVDGVHITRLLFADDLVLIDKSPEDASRRATAIANVCKPAGLVFNTSKSKVLRNQHASGRAVVVNKEPLEDVEKIKYLGKILQKDGMLNLEIANRIRAGWAAYNNIKDAISSMTTADKEHFLRTTVLPATTYASETWTTKVEDIKRIQRAVNCIWDAANAGSPPNVEGFIIRNKLRWAGHIARLPSNRICRRITEWQLPTKSDGFKRKPGGRKKRWADDVENEVKIHQHNQNLIGLGEAGRRRIGIISKKIPWPRIARSRSLWKCLVHSYNS